MEIVKLLITWTHVLSAAVSLVIGAMVLFKSKGTVNHQRMGFWYFYLMVVSNITALFIYNVTGAFFFPHGLAVVTLAVIIPGYLVAKTRSFRYWVQAHLIALLVSYYLLIGGAINEVFIHTESLRPYMLSQSPVYGFTHFIAMVFFIGLMIYFLIRSRVVSIAPVKEAR